MTDGSLPLFPQFRPHMAQPGSALNRRNIRRIVEGDFMHAIQHHDQVSILASKAEGRIPVATALRAYFHS